MRKHSHKVLFKITNKQIEAIERQYWSKYNNDTLESMLFYKQNTNQ